MPLNSERLQRELEEVLEKIKRNEDDLAIVDGVLERLRGEGKAGTDQYTELVATKEVVRARIRDLFNRELQIRAELAANLSARGAHWDRLEDASRDTAKEWEDVDRGGEAFFNYAVPLAVGLINPVAGLAMGAAVAKHSGGGGRGIADFMQWGQELNAGYYDWSAGLEGVRDTEGLGADSEAIEALKSSGNLGFTDEPMYRNPLEEYAVPGVSEESREWARMALNALDGRQQDEQWEALTPEQRYWIATSRRAAGMDEDEGRHTGELPPGTRPCDVVSYFSSAGFGAGTGATRPKDVVPFFGMDFFGAGAEAVEAVDDLTQSIENTTGAHDSWMSQLDEGQWVFDDSTGATEDSTGAIYDNEAANESLAMTLDSVVDPALAKTAVQQALLQAGIVDVDGSFVDLDEQSLAAAVGVLTNSEWMAKELGVSGAEMEAVLANLIGEYGILEQAIYDAARAAAQGVPAPSASGGGGGGGGGGGEGGGGQDLLAALRGEAWDIAQARFSFQLGHGAFSEDLGKFELGKAKGQIVGLSQSELEQYIAGTLVGYSFSQGRTWGEFAHGGLVPGPVGAPIMALVHGGERVLRSGQAGGGTTIIVNVRGSVMSEGDLIKTVRSGLLRLDRRVVGVLP